MQVLILIDYNPNMTGGTHYKRKTPKYSEEQLQDVLRAVRSKRHLIVNSNSWDICNTS